MKFFTDAQTRQSLVELLRKLGHEVTTAQEQALHAEKDDSVLVRWAQTFDHIFITFDDLRAESGMRVAREIKVDGGKVIKIGGGPAQEPERALGKLLFHWHDWIARFEEEDGVVEIGDLKPLRWYPRSRIEVRVRRIHRAEFDEYVKRREEAKKRPLKRSRRRRQHPQQRELGEDLQ